MYTRADRIIKYAITVARVFRRRCS
ncbi:unnamed protein product [Leptidea sinapis]|uniref:Uncharacterized protein n=1 Tax=Leptidea sinapis TaxID=189913 RepID=A0A5E4QZC8_9NEOP|nr:unnamed protein product [Leptidea sinapis]